MDDVMKAYWDKAVAYVENGDGHPGKLINQSFVHQRINKFHEVKFVLSICVWHAAFTGHESEQIDMYWPHDNKFHSQFCDCCKEEKWVRCTYHQAESGQNYCKRCLDSINSLTTPVFSAKNNMVGFIWIYLATNNVFTQHCAVTRFFFTDRTEKLSTLLRNFINTHVHALNLTCCMSHSRRFPECYLPNFAIVLHSSIA